MITIIHDRKSKSALVYWRGEDDPETGNERYYTRAGAFGEKTGLVERAPTCEMPLYAKVDADFAVAFAQAIRSEYDGKVRVEQGDFPGGARMFVGG